MYQFRREPLTTKAEDWPQKKFNPKDCKNCGETFSPESPCHLYCSDDCASMGKMSAYLKRTYSIDSKEYWRLHADQEGKCAVCQGEGFTMKESHKLKLVVDHCHTTGEVRGLLCHNCNRALGLLKDSKESLYRAIKYLETN